MQSFDYWYPGADNLSAFTGTTGVVITPALPASGSDVAGLTLANSTTYYVPLSPGDNSPMSVRAALASLHMKWAAAFAATITFETSNFPKYLNPGESIGPIVVSDYDTTVGNWIQENPSTAYVAIVGSGNSVSNLTITAGGSAAGGATIHLGNLGTRRLRAKLVVTTGGLIRIGSNGKVGA